MVSWRLRVCSVDVPTQTPPVSVPLLQFDPPRGSTESWAKSAVYCCLAVFGVERRGELASPCLFGGCADANSVCLSRVDSAAPFTTAPLCVCRQAFFPQDNVCRQYIYFTLANPKSHFSTLLFIYFRCRVTVLGKLFTPIVTVFTKQNW